MALTYILTKSHKNHSAAEGFATDSHGLRQFGVLPLDRPLLSLRFTSLLNYFTLAKAIFQQEN